MKTSDMVLIGAAALGLALALGAMKKAAAGVPGQPGGWGVDPNLTSLYADQSAAFNGAVQQDQQLTLNALSQSDPTWGGP